MKIRLSLEKWKKALTKEMKEFLLVITPFNILFSGGIATLLKKEAWFEFVTIFVMIMLIDFQVFDWLQEYHVFDGLHKEKDDF